MRTPPAQTPAAFLEKHSEIMQRLRGGEKAASIARSMGMSKGMISRNIKRYEYLEQEMAGNPFGALSSRAQNCLKAEHLVTPEDIASAYKKTGLNKIPNFGATSIEETRVWLLSLGLIQAEDNENAQAEPTKESPPMIQSNQQLIDQAERFEDSGELAAALESMADDDIISTDQNQVYYLKECAVHILAQHALLMEMSRRLKVNGGDKVSASLEPEQRK